MKKRLLLLFLVLPFLSIAQENEKALKTRFTNFLSNSYYSINFGGIFYPFSNDNLLPGYTAESISRNPFSGRLLLGHKMNETLSVQFGTMRPAKWLTYENINNINAPRSVWMNIWSLSLKQDLKLSPKVSLYGEAGIANLTRVGFPVFDDIVYEDAHYGSLLYGLGLQYWINSKWRLSLNGTFLPESQKHNQPSISQATFGFEYHLQQVDQDTATAYANNDYFFPENILQFGYGTGALGFGVNRFFSMNIHIGDFQSFGIPIFWLGDVKAQHALSLTYQRLIYRSEKIFSLDWGASVTYFHSEGGTDVWALSVFPVLRFYLKRTKIYDFYGNYSIIGPAWTSKRDIDGFDTGPKATFQDFMGFGAFFGKDRKYNIELRIMHYSNGNNFTDNGGVAIPIQFTFGRTF